MIPKALLNITLEHLDEIATVDLWEMVQAGLGFPPVENQRLKALIQHSKQQELSLTEAQELENLLELQGKYVLLRTNILVELQERGEDVKGYLDSD